MTTTILNGAAAMIDNLKQEHLHLFTLLKTFIFLSKKSTLKFLEKIVDFLGWKTRKNVVVLVFLAVDNFDFTRKIVKKIFNEKTVKMLGFCQNWIFGHKFEFSNSVKYL